MRTLLAIGAVALGASWAAAADYRPPQAPAPPQAPPMPSHASLGGGGPAVEVEVDGTTVRFKTTAARPATRAARPVAVVTRTVTTAPMSMTRPMSMTTVTHRPMTVMANGGCGMAGGCGPMASRGGTMTHPMTGVRRTSAPTHAMAGRSMAGAGRPMMAAGPTRGGASCGPGG